MRWTVYAGVGAYSYESKISPVCLRRKTSLFASWEAASMISLDGSRGRTCLRLQLGMRGRPLSGGRRWRYVAKTCRCDGSLGLPPRESRPRENATRTKHGRRYSFVSRSHHHSPPCLPPCFHKEQLNLGKSKRGAKRK